MVEHFKKQIFLRNSFFTVKIIILGIETAAEVAVDRRSGRVHEYRRRKQGASLCVQLACTRTLLELRNRGLSLQ
jgi:hypothetical protein